MSSIVRFSTAIIIACLCERGKIVALSKSDKVKVSLNLKKIAQRLKTCSSSEYMRTLCSTCMLNKVDVDIISNTIKQLELSINTSSKSYTEKKLMEDYMRIINILNVSNRKNNQSNLVASLRKFLRSVFEGDLINIFRSYLDLMRVSGMC